MVYVTNTREGDKMSNVKRVTQNVYIPSMHHRGRDHSTNECRGSRHVSISGAASAFHHAT